MTDPNLDRLFGPYRLRRVLGHGGMGTVYEAVDEATGERAAVKVLLPVLAQDPSFRDRFALEIESLKRLSHPNVVRLHGYGEQDGHLLFYGMDWVEGISLQEELRRGRRFHWRKVVSIGLQICAALKHAHDHGIIHRDLKPANLLLTPKGDIKLVDFGIAKLFGFATLTTGSVMGTADYMAPEQAAGKPVGPRADLYSLGSLMYALLAGRPPFQGQSVPEVVHKVRFEPPLPVGRLAVDVPVELEMLLEQLLEKDPGKRLPTALAVSYRLKALQHALSVDDESGAVPIGGLRAEDTPVPEGSDSGATRAPTSSSPRLEDQPTVTLDPEDPGNPPSQIVVQSDPRSVTRKIDSAQPPKRPSDGPKRPGDTTFTYADRKRSAPRGKGFPVANVLSVLATITVIGILVAAVVHRSRTPSADELYEEIQRLAGDVERGEADTLARKATLFLEHYGEDPRKDAVQKVLERSASERVLRAMRALVRSGREGGTAGEQLFVEALRVAQHDPAAAAERLAALSTLVQDATAGEPRGAQLAAAAALASARLKQQTQRLLEQHGPLLEGELNRALALEADRADEAARIYRSLLTLYEGKSWAKPWIARATERLEHLSAGRDAPAHEWGMASHKSFAVPGAFA